MKLKENKYVNILMLFAVSVIITSCQPEDFEVNNGLTANSVDPTFTLTPVQGQLNTYAVKSNAVGIIGVKYDKGDGGGFTIGKLVDTITYDDAGTFTFSSEVTGAGGKKAVSSKQLVINSSIPIENNLLQGANMDAGDEAFWLPIAYTPGVTFSIVGGRMIAIGGGWGQAGIYQTVQLITGKKYKIDMNVSGQGATDTWFEVYLGTAAPGSGDYTSGGNRMGLNTWTGCGGTAFSGKLSALSCVGSGNVVTATATGTAYLVIRSGGANLGATGIAIDRVSLIEVQ